MPPVVNAPHAPFYIGKHPHFQRSAARKTGRRLPSSVQWLKFRPDSGSDRTKEKGGATTRQGRTASRERPKLREGRRTTDKQLLLRIPVYVGIMLLLYTLASGLWLQYSGEPIEPGAIRQHSIVGILGSALCITAIIISVWKREK